MDHDHIEVAELRIYSLALYPPYGFGTSYPIVKYTAVTYFYLFISSVNCPHSNSPIQGKGMKEKISANEGDFVE